MLSVRGPKVSKYEVSSVASVFHPFIVHFPSSEAHSHFDFHFCSHRLHAGAFSKSRAQLHQGSGSFDSSCTIVTFSRAFNNLFT